ncbi:MAG: hypothetical protein EXX96DRAFT_560575, partial [Benjaminiella poitrasii]
MNQFIYKDGQGNQQNEEGEAVAVLQMENDEITYPTESVTDSNHYLDLKPPDKQKKEKKAVNTKVQAASNIDMLKNNIKKTYKKYSDSDKEYFFFLLYEKQMSLCQDTKTLYVTVSTASN